MENKATKVAAKGVIESPCQDGCPMSLNCHVYISLIKQGEIEKAYRAIRQRLPFPRTVGRICDAPCEARLPLVCRRGLVDDPVAIRDLKRFAADYAHDNGF